MFTSDQIIEKTNEWVDLLNDIYKSEPYIIGENGYYHVTVTRDYVYLDLNSYTIPVYYDGIIGSLIHIYRMPDGKIETGLTERLYQDDVLNVLLESYDVLVMVRGEFTELALTQDGKIHTIYGAEDIMFDPQVDLYAKYKTDYNTIANNSKTIDSTILNTSDAR